jgi:CheY-like chemotaxis protein
VIEDAHAEPPCILVVDDHEGTRELVMRVLRLAGYVVETAANPRLALEVLDRRRWDLYVVDFLMPVMTGTQLVQLIRVRQANAKVLYVTAFSARLFRETSVLRDDEGFLEKPFTIPALREAVSLLLFGHLRGLPGRATA